MPNGLPRYVRCYDNGGKTADRYNIVFTGNFKGREGRCYVLGCSALPFHPQGIGSHEDYDHVIDKPSYKHLGKKVTFETLPEDVKRCVLQDYCDYWELKNL